LTPVGFEALLSALHPDRDLAGVRYESIRSKLLAVFKWRGCTAAEDLADETLNRVAERLAAGLELCNKDGDSYFLGVARKVALEAEQMHRVESVDLGDTLNAAEDPTEDEPLEALQQCLESLTEGQRDLVVRYHDLHRRANERKILADGLGITMNSLRIRIHRLVRQLEECVRRRLE
jgi:DNA-directed RNA polymerase specialized sigma24 family protein